MSVIYKHFDQARTVFWLVLVYFLLSFSAYAQDSLYTVENVKVDVSAANALEARNQAFAKAQQDAFSTLAGRMLGESAMASFQAPPVSTISSLIKDYEVTKEKLSTVRYIGTYRFRFHESAVRQYFSGSGVAYSDVSSRPVMVLPYYQHGGQTFLWSPYNSWMQAWNRAPNLGGLVPAVVPLGDIQDVKDIGNESTLTYDERNLQSMLMRYGAGEAVMVVAIPDDSLALVTDGADVASGSLTLNIYRTDRMRPEYVSQIVQVAQSGQTRDELFDAAVRRVHQSLQKDWKEKTMVSAGQGNKLQVKIPFKSLSEWTITRRALQRVQGVSDIQVRSLTPKGARVDIVFQGAEQRLRLALQQADMTLSMPRFSHAGLTGSPQERFGRNAGGRNDAAMVYELYLNRYAPSSARRY